MVLNTPQRVIVLRNFSNLKQNYLFKKKFFEFCEIFCTHFLAMLENLHLLLKNILILPVPEKMKISILEIPKFSSTLNINNQKAISTNPINLGIMRKLIKYFFQKRGVDSIVLSYHFRDIAVRWKVGILTHSMGHHKGKG